MNSTELEIAWLSLKEKGPPSPGDLSVSELTEVPSGQKLLLGVDPEGYRHLLIVVRSLEHAIEDSHSTGVQIRSRQLRDGGRLTPFVDLICLRPDLNDLFDVLIIDIIGEVEKDDPDPGSVCKRLLERWRDLFAQDRQPVLSLDRLTGMVGELLYLRRILEVNNNAASVWLGPDKQRHDFASPSLALEVKTSRARYGRLCEIHGQDQLEAPPSARLYLGFTRVETPVPDGISVPDLVDVVLGLTSNRSEMIEKLRILGYDLKNSEAYRQTRFRITEERVYRVEEDFPRIVRASFVSGAVPPGVTALTYQIDLSGEPPCPVPKEEADLLVRTLAGDKTGV